MKKRRLIFLAAIAALCLLPALALADVDLNATNFPDPVFLAYLQGKFPNQTTLSGSNILSVVDIKDIPNRSALRSLEGVEHFTALQALNVSGAGLTALDVSHNALLHELVCENVPLAAIDLSHNPNLMSLTFVNTRLVTLDASGLPALRLLECRHNPNLLSLDASGSLKSPTSPPAPPPVIYCMSNAKLASLNLSGCTALQLVVCGSNALSALNLSGCTALTDLVCDDNKLTALDLSGTPALERLYCSNQNLTSLNVRGLTSLTELVCAHNRLTSLDVSDNGRLTSLQCHHNDLTALDITNSSLLTYLLCQNNYIVDTTALEAWLAVSPHDGQVLPQRPLPPKPAASSPPRTGDAARPAVWLALGLLAGTLALGLARGKTRKERRP